VADDIVLTGIGALAPAGGREAFFRALADGAAARGQDSENAALPAGGLTELLDIKSPRLQIVRYLDPVSKNAIVAVEEAMADAGIAPDAVAQDPYGFGVVLAATRGPGTTREKAYEQFRAREGKLLSSTLFSNFGYNIAAAAAAMAHGIKGPNLTVAGRANLSIHLLRRARQLLTTRRAHTVFTGFSECLPHEDAGRAQLLGEWACIFSLERADRARWRGVTGGYTVAETELSPLWPPESFAAGRAYRLPFPLPRPFPAANLNLAESLDLDPHEPAGIGPEHLPLIQAGRIRAARLPEKNACVALPVSTRTGFSLVGVARL
jgi:hypothetical protein